MAKMMETLDHYQPDWMIELASQAALQRFAREIKKREGTVYAWEQLRKEVFFTLFQAIATGAAHSPKDIPQ